MVPETDARLDDASAVGRRLVLNYLPRRAQRGGDPRARRQAPADAQASGARHGQGLLRPARPEGDLLLVRDLRSPAAILRLEPASGDLRVFRAPQLKFEPSEFESRQVFYPSKDGTRVPMTLTFRKGMTPDGKRPVLLYGYGGFDISETPRFSPDLARLDGAGRSPRGRQPPGRRRVRRGLAPGRDEAEEAERVRRLHRRGGVADPRALDAHLTAGHRGRLERRAAGGRGDDPAAGPLRLRAAHRRRDGHAPLPEVHHRLGLDLGLRLVGRPGAVQGALRLLAAAQHQAGDRVPADPGDHRRSRRPGGPGAQLQVHRRAPGRAGRPRPGAHPDRDPRRALGAGSPPTKKIEEAADMLAFTVRSLGMPGSR